MEILKENGDALQKKIIKSKSLKINAVKLRFLLIFIP